MINIYMPTGGGEKDKKGIELPGVKGTTPSGLDPVPNKGGTGGTSYIDEGSDED
jgi:hypothetical protein